MDEFKFIWKLSPETSNTCLCSPYQTEIGPWEKVKNDKYKCKIKTNDPEMIEAIKIYEQGKAQTNTLRVAKE